MIVTVFIENEAGSDEKHVHDEERLVLREVRRVSRPYPYPYGFLPGTAAEDGCCLDCFVVTGRPARTGEVIECVPLALLEQVEDGRIDHNVLARRRDEAAAVTPEVVGRLREFILHVFDHVEGKRIAVGELRDAAAAEEWIRRARIPGR